MTPIPSHIQLFAFDLDGTLADTESLALPSAVALMNEAYKVPVTIEYWYEHLHGLAGQALLNAIYEQFGVNISLADFVSRRAEQAPKMFENGVQPAPGMLQAVRNLVAAGQQLCICSNSMPERIDITLANITGQHAAGLTLPALFEGHIFSALGSKAEGKAKPAPDVYLEAARYYRATPKNCIAVEDSPVGVIAAVAAGFTCLGFTGLSHQGSQAAGALTEAGAQAVFSHWDEFLPLVGTLKKPR